MKSRSRNIILTSLAFIVLFVFAVSCTHKDLCYYHPHRAPVKIKVDWNGYKVDGMTAYLFCKEDINQTIQTTFTTHQVNEIAFDVLEGTYTAAIFNNTPDEYATLKFNDLSNYDEASVQVTETTAEWYNKYNVKSGDLYVAHQPEWIARGLSENFTITPEMVETAEKEYIDGGFREAARTVTLIDEIAPDSIICNMEIRVKLQGIDNYYQARGIVSGLALGKHINKNVTLNETVSHYVGMNSWKIDPESFDESGTTGEIVGTLTCFGLPSDFRGTKEEITLTLEIMLVDLKTQVKLDVPLEIGDLVKKREGSENLYMIVSIPFPKILPYVDPADGDEGGFGVDIEDWEREEIDILDH